MSDPAARGPKPDNSNNDDAITAAGGATTGAAAAADLPDNRFELELEFVQALASPAYIHFLATSRVESDGGTTGTTGGGDGSAGGSRGSSSSSSTTVLQDPAFLEFLKYLRRTWTQPEYARFLTYPHCLYFLDLLIEKHSMMSKEWTLPQFRNFCHQQQFLAWQHRHSVLYGQGAAVTNKEEQENNEYSGGDSAEAESGGLTTAKPPVGQTSGMH